MKILSALPELIWIIIESFLPVAIVLALVQKFLVPKARKERLELQEEAAYNALKRYEAEKAAQQRENKPNDEP